MQFSANLGFLFTEMPLPEAIRAAARAGFDAVECHFPYAVPAQDVRTALSDSGLKMLGLNTQPGNRAAGDFGLAALPGREEDARAAIDEAISYASAIGAANVHVMAGITDGGVEAETTFRNNLNFACEQAAARNLSILIEPINQRDAPGYHLCRVGHAAEIIADLGHPNLRLMFDCYHTQIMEGDLSRRIESSLPLIGHIQIAAVPDRGEPDSGEVNYPDLLQFIARLGYTNPIGAEYKPRGATTLEGLGWLKRFRDSLAGSDREDPAERGRVVP